MLNYHFILQWTNLVMMIICNTQIQFPGLQFYVLVLFFFQFLYQGNKNVSDSFSFLYIFRYIFYKIQFNYSLEICKNLPLYLAWFMFGVGE